MPPARWSLNIPKRSAGQYFMAIRDYIENINSITQHDGHVILPKRSAGQYNMAIRAKY